MILFNLIKPNLPISRVNVIDNYRGRLLSFFKNKRKRFISITYIISTNRIQVKEVTPNESIYSHKPSIPLRDIK